MRQFPSLFITGTILLLLVSPSLAQYSGTYDIGGTSPDFSSIVSAANLIRANGVSGPVICNIHSGTFWEGQVTLRNIPGLSAVNTLTFQNAPGESPVVRAPYYNMNVFKIDSADYITIQGLEIKDCEEVAIAVTGSETDSCKHVRIIGNYIHNIGTNLYSEATAILLSFSADCEANGNRVDGDAAGISVWGSKRILIANNMVYSCAVGINPGVHGCIVGSQSDNLLIYHNSCYSSVVASLYMSSCNDAAVRDNIFYQAGSGTYSAIQIYLAAGLTCDYNDLFAPNADVGYYVYSYQTLAEWQAGTGFDLHSISANPNYASSTNLHVNQPSPLGFAGITVADVTTDYDGQTRKTPNPDIGADEFIFPLAGSYDVGGGANHFATPIAAANQAVLSHVNGAVTFNIYSGTYNGQVNLPAISGINATNTITFQAASGQIPIITNTVGTTQTDGNGFYLTGADYITIQNLEITNTVANGIFNTNAGSDSSSHNRFVDNYIHDVGTSGDYQGIYFLNTPDCEVAENEIRADYNGIKLATSHRNLVANNMIYFAGLCGIYESEGTDNSYYYNSLYQEMSPTATNNIYIYHGANITLKNNILFQNAGGAHYALSISGDFSSYPLTSDYNDFYAPSSYVGFYNGNRTTLADWQSATGQDAHSISANPNYVSSTDLHVSEPSPAGYAGISIPGVLTDFDGETRKSPISDIGADEFVYPLAGVYDVGGGANHFPTPIAAADRAALVGVSANVTFAIYSGTYNGQVNLPAIYGASGTSKISFQAATGQNPVITNTIGTTQTDGNGFYLNGADWVTIRNLEITNTAANGIFCTNSGADSSTNDKFRGNYIHNVGSMGNYAGIYLFNTTDCEILGNKIDGDYYGTHSSTSKRNTVANNMIYFSEPYGIYDSESSNNFYYFNSVYQEANPSATYNIYLYHGNNNVLKNNILYQAGTGAHCAIYVVGDLSTYPLTSDYNDFYAPNALVGFYDTNLTTLMNWQTATGRDAHSLSVDPSFVSLSTPDLHILPPSLVDLAGTPVFGTTTDFDGESRYSLRPDIGADEFSHPLSGTYDVGGGNNTFPDPAEAAEFVADVGMSGPVTFNTYTGTYSGVILPSTITGLSSISRLTFQNAPGQSPRISTLFLGGSGFRLTGTDHVTIQGFEIYNCGEHGILILGTLSNPATNNRVNGNYIYNVGQGTSGPYAGISMSYANECLISSNEMSSPNADYGILTNYGDSNRIFNNMISYFQYAGIYTHGSTEDEIYYNSVLNGGTTAIYLDSRATVKNNIFYQIGTGQVYAIYIPGPLVPPITSDYNDLYAPLSYVGYYSGNRPTLLHWRLATGWDANSIGLNPEFVSIPLPSDLHIAETSPVIEAGIFFSGVTSDFDGNPRDPVTPDIGADEFAPAGPPEAIDDLIITLSSSTDDSTNITLIWSPVAGAVQYHVYKSVTGPNSGYVLIGSAATTTFTDTNAIIGESTSFYYVTTDNEP